MMQSSEEKYKSVREKYHQLTKILIENHLTITTMESVTSGQIASLITDTEGSSAVFKGAFVTYCNEAKVLQGVPKEIIDVYGVYSNETSQAMACACQKVYDTDIAIGVTGTTGNVDPANQDSVLGCVYYSIWFQNQTMSQFVEIPPLETRLDYKMCVAQMIVDQLLALLS